MGLVEPIESMLTLPLLKIYPSERFTYLEASLYLEIILLIKYEK